MGGNIETRVTFVGDLTVDKYPKLKDKLPHLGGASLNSAVWALRVGADSASVIAAVGTDDVGKDYFAKMKLERVNADGVSILPGRTSSIEIFVDPGTGERRWGTWDGGVLEQYHLGNREFDLLRLARAASLTIYGKTVHLLPEFAGWGREHKTRPILAVNFDDLSQFDRSLKIVTDHLDGFDAAFFGLDREADGALITELEHLASDTGKLMIVTLGKHGAVGFKGIEKFESPAVYVAPGSVKDTTGAGDAFLAACIVEHMRTGGDIAASLAKGNLFGAQKIQILGAY